MRQNQCKFETPRRIRIRGVAHTLSKSPGVAGNDSTQLDTPTSVELHGSDDMVIADRFNSRVQVCPLALPGSPCTTVAGWEGQGAGSGQLDRPRGATVDGDGNYLIADTQNHRVQLCASNLGNCTTVAGTGNSGDGLRQLAFPNAVAVDAAGDYVIADTRNDRVVQCPSSAPGSDCVVMVSGLNFPTDVSILTSGEYLITDRDNHRVLLCSPSPDSNCMTVAGLVGQGRGSKQLNRPFAAAIDANGDYVIADTLNNRIQLCSAVHLGANCTTVAGTGESGSSAVELNSPTGVAVVNSTTTTTSSSTTTTGSTSTTTKTSSTLTTTKPSSTLTTTKTSSTLTTTKTSSTLTTTKTSSMSTTTNTSSTSSTTNTSSTSTTTETSSTPTTTNAKPDNRDTTNISNNTTYDLDASSRTPHTATDITTTTRQSRVTEAVLNKTVRAADSACEEADVVCSFGLYPVLAGAVLVTLCCCVCSCILCGALWHWRRTRGHGQWYIEAIGCKCRYRTGTRAERGIQKMTVTWEIDPTALARFASVNSNDPDHQDIRDTCKPVGGLDEEDGRGAIAMVEDSTSPREICHISSGSSSCSCAPGNDRLVLRSGRHLSREGYEVNPVAEVQAAYPHKSSVEYYSCTHHSWLRGVVTLDALDRYVHGSQRMEEVVYGVHLTRTKQFRNHVALYHLRRPLETGDVIEVPTNLKTTWKSATIKKITLGKTERFYVLDLEGKEAIVPVSSVRRCFPINSEVFRDLCVGSQVESLSSQNRPFVCLLKQMCQKTREERPSRPVFLDSVLTQLPSQL